LFCSPRKKERGACNGAQNGGKRVPYSLAGRRKKSKQARALFGDPLKRELGSKILDYPQQTHKEEGRKKKRIIRAYRRKRRDKSSR